MSERVLFLIPTLNLGGAERSLIKAATHLAEDGAEVAVGVLSQGTRTLQDELSRKIEIFYLDGQSASSPLLWWKVRQLILKWRPRLLCGWSMYANLVAIVASVGIPDLRVAVSERNFLPAMLGRPGVSRARRWLLKMLVKRIYVRADVITANSEKSLHFLRRYLGRKNHYALLPNIVDVDRLNELGAAPLRNSLESGREVRLVCVGRLDYQKGFDILLAAVAQLEPLCAWRLVIVGDGPLRMELEQLTKGLRFRPGQVLLEPSTSNPFPYYKWADIVVIPSRFEGFPNVALEAMALGKPIVASNCRSGPSELTCKGTFGLLVPPENSKRLADAVLRLCADATLRETLGIAGREHVLATYTWPRVRSSYQRLFTP